MFRLAAWLVNWWALLAIVAGLFWWARRMWTKSKPDHKGRINGVVLAGSAVYICAQMIPLSWAGQIHHERTRSVDVRFVETPESLRSDARVAEFLKGRSPGEKAFAEVLHVRGTDVLALVRRQSNRNPQRALDELLRSSPGNQASRSNTATSSNAATVVNAGALGGTAGCRDTQAGSNEPRTCAFADYGLVGTFISDLPVNQLGAALPEMRQDVEQRVDRYHPFRDGFAFAAFIIGILALIIASTVSHELSHAGLARLVGCDVAAICVGAGRILFDRDIRGVRVLIKAMPLGGYVQNIHRSARGYRWRQATISAAGPVENLAIALALTHVLPATHPAVLLNVAMALINLVPFSKYIPEAGQRIGTDGYQVIQVLSGKRTYNPASVTAMYEVRAQTALERDLPQEAQVWVAKGLAAFPENENLLELQERVLAAV